MSVNYILTTEADKIEISKKELSSSTETVFGQLTEYHAIKKYRGIIHSYTYKVPGEYGNLHEVTKIVDSELNRKLRVGDTVAVKRKTVESFGKKTVISKIAGNKMSYQSFDLMIKITMAGTLFFTFILLLSFLVWLKDSPPYSQKDHHL